MHVASREPTDVPRGDTECTVLHGAAPGPGTHLAEGRKAFCAGVQATVPFLGIQGEPAWEGKSSHGEEGAAAWGEKGLYSRNHRRSFPVSLTLLRLPTPSFHLSAHLCPGRVTFWSNPHSSTSQRVRALSSPLPSSGSHLTLLRTAPLELRAARCGQTRCGLDHHHSTSSALTYPGLSAARSFPCHLDCFLLLLYFLEAGAVFPPLNVPQREGTIGKKCEPEMCQSKKGC